MEALTIILLFLTSVVASNTISRSALVALPLPLVQIALGALIAQVTDFRIALEPEIFLLLFIAPLLFLDGWRIPKEGLLRDRWTIIALALGLVLFTVVGAGFFIHWMIPAMPLAVAFALAAVLSPTDAVSVSAIAARVPIPKRLMHVLEGESLLNDASGLVCLRFAIAAAVSGTFSFIEATGTFVWLAVAGIAIGTGLTWIVTTAKDWFSQRFGEDTGAQILISLLIPFAAYILAEQAHASGILAAVAAGIMMNVEEQSGRASATTRIKRNAVWEAVQFAGNGAIFVLLGQQLPGIVAGARNVVWEAGHQNEIWLIIYIVAISCVLIALRFLWAWASLGLIMFRAARHRQTIESPGWRLLAVTSVAGVRGALTLAGIMTLPYALQDGSIFPARDLAILLAAGTIILSLIVANVTLPVLLKGVRLPEETLEREENGARVAAAQAAIAAVEKVLHETGKQGRKTDLYMEAGARIIALYRQRIESHTDTNRSEGHARDGDDIERRLRLVALRAERSELYRFARAGRLPDELTRSLVREIDLMESRFSTR